MQSCMEKSTLSPFSLTRSVIEKKHQWSCYSSPYVRLVFKTFHLIFNKQAKKYSTSLNHFPLNFAQWDETSKCQKRGSVTLLGHTRVAVLLKRLNVEQWCILLVINSNCSRSFIIYLYINTESHEYYKHAHPLSWHTICTRIRVKLPLGSGAVKLQVWIYSRMNWPV